MLGFENVYKMNFVNIIILIFICSEELKCKMNFSVYLPPKAEDADVKLPVIYWLSGL